jgi:tetratricopeptide (TPR) repeat protein
MLRESHMTLHSNALKLTIVATLLAGIAMPAHAVDSGGNGGSNRNKDRTEQSDSGPSLTSARRLIRAQNWAEAVEMLKLVVAQNPDNADANNLLGYSLRKLGDYKNAQGFYLKALKLDPRHKGAHEYLGELYVEIGQMQKAKQMLDQLEQICGNTRCEEYRDLAEFIAARA